MAAQDKDEGEWPHHQILRAHRLYAFRQHLRIQAAVPYLLNRKAISKSLAEEIAKFPSQTNDDYNINFLLGYLREAKVERFIRFIEALGDSIASALAECKSHRTLIDTMSEGLENISNADIEQVRRVRAVVKMARKGQKTETEEGVVRGFECHTPVAGASVQQTESVVSESESSTGATETELVSRHEYSREKTSVGETQLNPERKTDKEPAISLLQPMEGFVKPGIAKFCHRDSLMRDQKSWIIYDSMHGIEMDIPVEAVPPEILQFAVIAHAYLNGNFKIPEEYEVCTAIFTLRTHPFFHFVKPVSLKLPHSVIFDGDEDDEDFVILCALDPMSKTEEYDFCCDIITTADFSEDYYVQVKLDHFSAVAGAKRKQKYRSARRGVPRGKQNSTNKQRRSIKNARRKRLKNIKSKQSGDSVGSSLHSSYEASFDRDPPQPDPNLLRQVSSTERDAPAQRSLLQRQGAIDDTSGAPGPLVHQASSGAGPSAASCNEICIAYCYPTQCLTSWTNRFLVAPNHPTGRKALHDSKIFFEMDCQLDIECVLRTAIPSSRIIWFYPEKWISDGWIVEATSTPKISLDIVQDAHWISNPQFVDFRAESTNQQSSATLKHNIRVTGLEEELFFAVHTTKKSITRTSHIHIKSWVYTKDSHLLQVLGELAQGSEESNLALMSPEHQADVCKLIAEIAFQVREEDIFFEQLPVSDPNKFKERLFQEEYDMTECIYRALFVWIREKRPHLLELKWLLQTIGFKDFVLSCSDAPMRNFPEFNDRLCDRMVCTHLTNKLKHRHWKFIGRFLGLGTTDIDNLQLTAHGEGLTEAISKMLEMWRQQFGNEASLISLLRAVYRVNQLGLCCMQDAVGYLEKELCSTE